MIPFVHNVKCLSPYFKDVCAGIKTAEVRVDNRPYMVGDVMVFHEYHEDKLTGNTVQHVSHTFSEIRNFAKKVFVSFPSFWMIREQELAWKHG